MFAKWMPCHVALVDGGCAARVQLRQRLEQGGYAPVVFADAAELLACLSLGKRFDLVLVVEDDEMSWCQLSAVCRVLCLPALLLTRESSWKPQMARAQDFLASPLFDFALLACEDSELYTRIYTLLLRAAERTGPVAPVTPIAPIATVQDVAAGDYQFVEGLQTVLLRGTEIRLSARQFELASALFRNVGRMVESRWLWSTLWGEPLPHQNMRALHVCAAAVRKKLNLYPENGFTLRAVYMRGYQLRAVTSHALAGVEAQ